MIWLLATVAARSPSPVKQIDVVETGRVLAQLDDWRSIMLVQLSVIGVLVAALLTVVGLFIWAATRRSASDQATISALTDNTKALSDMSASVRALEVIAARRESERA